MPVYEIVTASKSELATEEALRSALAKHKTGFVVENIKSDDDTWTVRLATKTADKPDFLKEKGDSDDADSSDSPDDADSSSDDPSDSDSNDDSDSDSDSDGDGKKKGDPVGEVKKVIDQLTSLFTDLGGKVQDLQAAHDDKAQKLKDISDTVGPDGADGDGPPGLPPGLEGDGEAVGPTPGHPAPPMPGPKMDKRKPPMPGMPGGGLPAFTHTYEVATHPGVNSEGKKISLTAAAVEMENDPDFAQYEVAGMTENADGTFSAKLKLRA